LKVIVNNHTPLTVEDEKGNVLFQWLPQQTKEYIPSANLKSISDEERKQIYDMLRKTEFTTMKLI
jgi:hypothetical protein